MSADRHRRAEKIEKEKRGETGVEEGVFEASNRRRLSGRIELLRDHTDPAPFFVDDRHRLIAVRAFYIDEIVKKTDAVMID